MSEKTSRSNMARTAIPPSRTSSVNLAPLHYCLGDSLLKKLLLFLLLVVVACALALGILRKSAPPLVRFTQVKRQVVVSTVPTNGKVEPYEWEAAHAETAGLVTRVDVQNGKRVAAGAVLA